MNKNGPFCSWKSFGLFIEFIKLNNKDREVREVTRNPSVTPTKLQRSRAEMRWELVRMKVNPAPRCVHATASVLETFLRSADCRPETEVVLADYGKGRLC